MATFIRRVVGLFTAVFSVAAIIPPKPTTAIGEALDDYARLMRARADAIKWGDCMRVWTQVGNRERFERCAQRFDDAAATIIDIEERIKPLKRWSKT